jgi:excisionase family DNA binding protein
MKSSTQPTPNHATPKIMTVQEVADLLQIPKSSVYEKTRSRPNTTPPLPCRRVGKYLRFFDTEVMAWIVALPRNKLMRKRRAECAGPLGK